MVKRVKLFKTERKKQNNQSGQLRYVVKYNVRKMAKSLLKHHSLLLSNVIDADHQNSCLFTNKGHFPSPLCVLIGVLAKCHE